MNQINYYHYTRVDVDTGEILDKETSKKNYNLIRKTYKVTRHEYNGKHIANIYKWQLEYRRKPQLTLF